MTELKTIEIPDELFTQIQGMALSRSRSINEQIVTLLQQALEAEMQRQSQAGLLQEIHQARWTPPATMADSVAILRDIRGYDD